MPRETSGLKFGLQQLYHDIVLEKCPYWTSIREIEYDQLGYEGIVMTLNIGHRRGQNTNIDATISQGKRQSGFS